MLDEGIFVFEDQEALCLNDYEQNKTKKCVISHYHTVLYLFQMPPEDDISGKEKE